MNNVIIMTVVLFLCISCATTSRSSSDSSPSTFSDTPSFEMVKTFVHFEKILKRELEKKEVVIRLHPSLNAVSIDFPSGVYHYALFFDKNARGRCVAAIGSFLSGFETKSLNTDAKRKNDLYGVTMSKMAWGKAKTTSEAEILPELRFSHEFKNDIPYFTIFIPGMDNRLYSGASATKIKFSVDMCLFLSRSEAEALKEYFSEEYIMEKLKEADPFVNKENRDVY